MSEEQTHINSLNQRYRPVLIDLEFEHYLLEVYLNDKVEHEIQRMMEYEQRSEPKTKDYERHSTEIITSQVKAT